MSEANLNDVGEDGCLVEATPHGTIVNQIQTICRDCIFAEMASGQQNGCSAGLLSKFDPDDIESEYSEKENLTYYRIKRYCPMCRNNEWLSKQKDQGLESARELARKESTLKYSVVIYYDDCSTLAELEQTARSLGDQKLPPAYVIAVMRNSGDSPSQVLDKLRENLQCETSVEFVYDSTEPNPHYALPDLEAIDLGVKRCTGQYYSVALAGHTFPVNFFSTLDEALNDEMIKFLYVPADETGNGAVFQMRLHQGFGGNRRVPDGPQNLIEKIHLAVEADKCQHLIKTFDQLSQK